MMYELVSLMIKVLLSLACEMRERGASKHRYMRIRVLDAAFPEFKNPPILERLAIWLADHGKSTPYNYYGEDYESKSFSVGVVSALHEDCSACRVVKLKVLGKTVYEDYS